MNDIGNAADPANVNQPTGLPAEDEFFGRMNDPTAAASVKGFVEAMKGQA